MTKQEEVRNNPNYTTLYEHGFVGLVETMGSDSAIAAAARVSYGEGTKSVSDNRNLIRYLIRHKHTSPVEMAEVKYHLKLPIFVMRQLVRHRTACLTGDVTLWFDLPSGPRNNHPKRHNLSIAEVYDKFHNGAQPIGKHRLRVPMKKIIQGMMLRNVNEDTNELQHTRIKDIWRSGVKPVYKITFEDDYSITSSADHRYFTDHGWKTLKDVVSFCDDGSVRLFRTDIAFATNGEPCYKNEAWLKHNYWAERKTVRVMADEAGCTEAQIRNWLRKHKLQDTTFSRFIGKIPSNKGMTYTLNLSEEQHDERSRIASHNAKRGSESNFWRGGITTDRAQIARWTRAQSERCFKKFGYRCAITGVTATKFNAHHLDPVSHNLARAYDFDNLICLSEKAHHWLHANNLELIFLDWVQSGRDSTTFCTIFGEVKLDRLTINKPKQTTKLAVKYRKLVSVEFAGDQETYDLEVSGPFHNFVANGVCVHNSLNEYSARYSVLSDEFYIPSDDYLAPQSTVNNQGRAGALQEHFKPRVTSIIRQILRASYKAYATLLGQSVDDEHIDLLSDPTYPGLSRELARIVIPVANYTECYWKCDLHNFFNFARLRMDSHAQREIVDFATAMYELAKPHFPLACQAFEDYIFNSVTLSAMDFRAIQDMLAGTFQPNSEHYGMSKREFTEFTARFVPTDRHLAAKSTTY